MKQATIGFLTVWLAGCAAQAPCPGGGAANSEQSAETPFVGTGDPYQPGPLRVRTISVARCEQGAPVPLLIHAPEQTGTYAVVVFQHGFLSRNEWYTEILTRLASHGFVVVAPQMYEPGAGVLFGNPTVQEEAQTAAGVLDWLPDNLASLAGVNVRIDRLGLAGHSRGGKVAWRVLSENPARAQAVAGVDPVDGAGGPLGNQPRVVQGPFQFEFPSLVIGTGLGGDCAPAGDNHIQFYEASAAPAWHVVAIDAGHGDMLDETAAISLRSLCGGGPDRAGMRRLTGGLLAAFFRGALQGDAGALEFLTNSTAAPLAITVESK